MSSSEQIDIIRRFGGVARLYGERGLLQLSNAHVCVIGIGGVGSWAVEALARSAIGEITMIDMDVVSESNINRQLPAMTDTLGKDKIGVMQERIQQINPSCKVHCIDDFVTVKNVAELLPKTADFVLDCIDDFRTKAAIINYCKRNKIRMVTLGGAGGQADPSKIRLCDLSRTEHDALFAKTRKLLRQEYNFARNPKRSFGIPCVYSDEQAVYPDGKGGLSKQRPSVEQRESSSGLGCDSGVGSITHVTASFAFLAVSHVLEKIAHG